MAPVRAIDLTANGTILRTIGPNDLTGGAGSHLNPTYENLNDLALSISTTTGIEDNWRVDVRRSDTLWHSSLTLSVKRTGDGLGSGLISGGLSYLPVDVMDTSFFSGSGDRSGINLGIQLSGMSVSVPPNNYSTTLTFTVVDIF